MCKRIKYRWMVDDPMGYLKPLKIGEVAIPGNLVLAPMAAVNCPAFRALCAMHGASLTYTQMIDADELEGLDERFISRFPEESCLSVQLIGSRPDTLKEAVKGVDRFADIIDINLGCAEKGMLGKQSGAFLLKHPEQIGRVVSAVKQATEKPVTAKIRSGWDEVNAVQVARILEKLGVSAVAVHPRTRKQGYTGKADLSVIRQVKDAVRIPVIGNGDVTRPEHVKAMLERTGCDAVMIGRAAMSNPFIFRQTSDFFSKGSYSQSDPKQISLEFISLYKRQKRQNIAELRQHVSWFYKGRSKDFRRRIEKAEYMLALERLIGT